MSHTEISNSAGDVMNPIQDVVWLGLDLDRLPENETLEFNIRKPLFAASVILGFVKNLSEGHLTVRAQISAKLPLLGNKQIEVTSRTNFLSETSGFFEYEERQFGMPARRWSFQDGHLEMQKDGETSPRQMMPLDPHSVPASHLLNSLLVLTALTSSVPADASVYASQFVTAGKLYALKFERASGSPVLKIVAKEIAHALTSDDWLAIDWTGAHHLEGVWNLEDNVVTALKIRVPVFGLIELPLSRSSQAK